MQILKPRGKNPLLNRWISQYVNYISIKLLIRKRISAAPGALWQTAGNRTKKIHSICTRSVLRLYLSTRVEKSVNKQLENNEKSKEFRLVPQGHLTYSWVD